MLVTRVAMLAAVLASIAGTSAAADPPPPLGWYSTSGLSYVRAGGNSGASTLGARVELKRLLSKSTFTLGGSAVRADATDPPRLAVETSPGSFDIETGPRVPKAAKYNATAAFDRRVTDLFGWQTGAEFDRDRFSGLEARSLGFAGVRYLLANRKDFVLKTGLAATLVHQSELVEDPAVPDTFAGVRLTADAERKLGPNSTYVGGLAVDENLKETADLRVRFANALAVSMSERLSLQVGLLLLYDNLPSLVEVPILEARGSQVGVVSAPAATLDTTFTVSVVVSFAPRAAAP
jgi:hypothetical protein